MEFEEIWLSIGIDSAINIKAPFENRPNPFVKFLWLDGTTHKTPPLLNTAHP